MLRTAQVHSSLKPGICSAASSRFAVFAEVGTAYGASPQQVALAWELAPSPGVIPTPGATRVKSVRDSVVAADLRLSEEELALLDAS